MPGATSRPLGRGRVRHTLVSAALAAALASALLLVPAVATAAEPAPFPDLPATPGASPGGCLTVLVVGDSIAHGIDDVLQDELGMTPYEYCARVVPAALAGSNTCQWRGFGWFDTWVAATDPDVVVAHFLPNEGFLLAQDPVAGPSCPRYGDPAWLTVNLANTDAMERHAATLGIPLYWLVPAPSYAGSSTECFAPDRSPASAELAQWGDTIAGRYRHEIDLRPVFGAPDARTWQEWFRLPTGVDVALRTPAPDCVHFSPLGYRVAAGVVRAGIADEWRR